MGQFNPKDLTFEWEVPKRVYNGRRDATPDNFILIKNVKSKVHGTKWSSALLDFKAGFVEKYFTGVDEVQRLAFSFEKDRLIMVINPREGIPYFRTSKNGKGRSLANITLVQKIWDYFKLEAQNKAYFLKIHYFAEINGMELYVLTPQDFMTRLPIFEDELKGDNFTL